MSKSLKRVTAALEAAGVETTIHELTHAKTAAEAAASLGVAVDQIANSIIFRAEDTGQAVLFLTAGGNRVDTSKASQVAGTPLGKADAAVIRAQTGFAIGGVAPLGHLNPITAYWDPKLSEFDKIFAAAGTPHHVFGTDPATMMRLAAAQVADFTI